MKIYKALSIMPCKYLLMVVPVAATLSCTLTVYQVQSPFEVYASVPYFTELQRLTQSPSSYARAFR